MTIDRRSMLFGAFASLALGCARPEPPRITPRSADVTGVTQLVTEQSVGACYGDAMFVA